MWSRIAVIGAAGAVILVAVFLLVQPFSHRSQPDIRIDFGGKARRPQTNIELADDGVASGSSGEIATLVSHPILFVDGKVNVSRGSATPALQASYAKIRSYMSAHHLKAAGPPVAINEDFDTIKQIWKYRAGIPLASAPATPPTESDGIILATSYGGIVARFVHLGDPNQAELTYAKIDIWMKAKGLRASGPTWEEYTSDPQTPVAAWRTNIYVPIG
jgi:effector-binding domain-containing protein